MVLQLAPTHRSAQSATAHRCLSTLCPFVDFLVSPLPLLPLLLAFVRASSRCPPLSVCVYVGLTCLHLRSVVEVEVESGLCHSTDVGGDGPIEQTVQRVSRQIVNHPKQLPTTTKTRQDNSGGGGEEWTGVYEWRYKNEVQC